MVRIRLRRVGAKKQPSYRVVVADSRSPRDGRFIEAIGHYNPRTSPPTVVLKEDRALYWLGVGAQPSEAVARFFQQLGLYDKLAGGRAGGAAAPEPADRPEEKVAGRAARVVAKPTPEPVEPEAEMAEMAPVAEEPAVEGEPEMEAAPVEETVGEAEAGVPTGEMMVADLGLPTRIANALESAGVTSAGDLAARLAGGELGELPGIGPKAVDEIRARLSELGLAEA